MSEFDSEGWNPWTYYTSSNLTTSSLNVDVKGRPPWLVSPMNAVSFGFVDIAILVSLFLIMAIFEQIFGQIPSFTSPEPVSDSSVENVAQQRNPDIRARVQVELANALEITVTMPGDHQPTRIAQPAPLPPSSPREGIHWPHHHHHHVFTFC